MNKKSFIIVGSILAILIIVAVGIGLSKRETHDDPFKDSKSINDVNVAALRKDQLSSLEGTLMDTIINDCEIVIKATALTIPEFDYQTVTQKVRVEKIFKGEGLEVGDEIKVDRMAWAYFESDNSMNMWWVNYMKVGDEYMIFIHDVVDAELYDEIIYRSGGFILTPIFNYKNVENTLVDVNVQQPYAKYGEYGDSEFFCGDEETEQALKKFKYEIMSKYDDSVETFE